MRPSEAYESRIIRPDGEVRYLVSSGTTAFTRDGKVERVLGVIADITERKRNEERLAVSARLASLGTLATGVAHEINNPLTYVLSNLGLIERRLASIESTVSPTADAVEKTLELARSARRALVDASEGAERVAGIVQSLRTFGRAEAPGTPHGPVDVTQVLEQALRLAHSEIKSRARLDWLLDTVPRVQGSETELGQVFLNLLINAAQAIPAGEPEKNLVRVELGFDGERVFVKVADTGIGIRKADLPHIFDPFFTTKPAGVGVGLGLSICHGLVHAMNGALEVDSTPGEGTTFRVLLPPHRDAASSPG